MRGNSSPEFFAQLFEKASKAGFEAGSSHTPRRRVHKRFSTQGDYTAWVEDVWMEEEGAFGFAYIEIRPKRSPFTNWLKLNKKARDGNGDFVVIVISDHGNSYEKKLKHAETMASIFRENGINAYSKARLD